MAEGWKEYEAALGPEAVYSLARAYEAGLDTGPRISRPDGVDAPGTPASGIGGCTRVTVGELTISLDCMIWCKTVTIPRNKPFVSTAWN